MSGLLILIGIGWFVIAVLVMMDADHRPNNAFAWFFITLIAGVFGVLAYLLLRKPKRSRAR